MSDDGWSGQRLSLLVRSCWPDLFRTGYLMTGEPTAAGALVESALRRRLDQVRGGTADPAVALRDAVVREAFRHRSLYAAGAAPFAEQADAAEPLRAVLRRLPLDERAVLLLRHGQGLTVDQVVDVLRVPADVVREREERALRAARTAGLTAPDPLRTLLDAVEAAVPLPAPPEVPALLSTGSTADGRRMLVFGLVALAVALVAAARWLM